MARRTTGCTSEGTAVSTSLMLTRMMQQSERPVPRSTSSEVTTAVSLSPIPDIYALGRCVSTRSRIIAR